MENRLKSYIDYIKNCELAYNTKSKYIKDAEDLEDYLAEDEITPGKLLAYKKYLIENYKTSTVNSKLGSINKYLSYNGLKDLKLKLIKVQSKSFNDNMTITDFNRLMRYAKKKGTKRDELMLWTFYYTGIRVSELKYFTVESVRKGCMEFYSKGKHKTVVLSSKLRKMARKYIKDNKIASGPILMSREGNPISDSTVKYRLKKLSGWSKVSKAKCHPHAIRHLMAKQYLEAGGDIMSLADQLGHSSLDITRIYTKATQSEMRSKLDRM